MGGGGGGGVPVEKISTVKPRSSARVCYPQFLEIYGEWRYIESGAKSKYRTQ